MNKLRPIALLHNFISTRNFRYFRSKHFFFDSSDFTHRLQLELTLTVVNSSDIPFDVDSTMKSIDRQINAARSSYFVLLLYSIITTSTRNED